MPNTFPATVRLTCHNPGHVWAVCPHLGLSGKPQGSLRSTESPGVSEIW